MSEQVSSHIDDLMNDMGMSSDPDVTTTDGDIKTDDDTTADNKQEDLSVSNETTDDDKHDETTDLSKLESLQSQIDGMEKRLKDKDDFINELRDQVKAKEANENNDDTDDTEEEGFWDKPEETIKQMQEQLRIQSLQYQEVIYANGVENYFKTVNGKDLKEAVSSDPEFAKEFNSSAEPYRVAYEYLTQRNAKQAESRESERAAIRAELLKEIAAEQGTQATAPAGITNTGSSNRSGKTDAPEDGFASIYG